MAQFLPSPNPKAASNCPIKHGLISKLEQAHARIVSVGDREVQAMLRGEFQEDASVAGELDAARHKRDQVVQALREHMTDHGC